MAAGADRHRCGSRTLPETPLHPPRPTINHRGDDHADRLECGEGCRSEDNKPRVILPKGWYAGVIVEANDTEWDSGARGVVVSAKIRYTDEDGKKRVLKGRWQHCYQGKPKRDANGAITEPGQTNRVGNKQVFKLLTAAGASIGADGSVEKDEDSGEILELTGAKVDIYLKITPKKGEYPEKNEADSYLPLGTKSGVKQDAAAKAATAAIEGQAAANEVTKAEQAAQQQPPVEPTDEHPFDDDLPF